MNRMVISMADTVSGFIDSNLVVIFLIVVAIIIMIGVFYGTKLWCEIREVRKSLKEMDMEKEEGSAGKSAKVDKQHEFNN